MSKKILSILLILFGLLIASVTVSQSDPPKPVTENEKIISQTELIDASLKSEGHEVKTLKKELDDLQGSQQEFESTLTKYRIELTTLNSQIHLTDLPLKQIETFFMTCQTSLATVSETLTDLKKREEALISIMDMTYEQKRINDTLLMEMESNSKQLAANDTPIAPIDGEPNNKSDAKGSDNQPPNASGMDVSTQSENPTGAVPSHEPYDAPMDAANPNALMEKLNHRLKHLQTLHIQKLLLLQSIKTMVSERATQLKEVQGQYQSLATELETRLKQTKKSDLITRKNNALTQDTWNRLGEDLKQLLITLSALQQQDVWENSFNFLWVSGIQKLFSFSTILLLILLVTLKLKSSLQTLLASPYLTERYWSRLTVTMLRKHLILFNITTYLYICINFKLFFNYATTANLIVALLMILTAVLWGIHFVKLIEAKYPHLPCRQCIFSLKTLNLLFMLNTLLLFALESDSSITVIFRLFSEIVIYGGSLYFAKKIFPKLVPEAQLTPHLYLLIQTSKNALLLISGIGIILDLLGYGPFVIYWYTSWTKTVIVIMWSALVIGASNEWIPGTTAAEGGASLDPSFQKSSTPHVGQISLMWLFKQICYLLLFLLSTMALYLAWGNSDTLLKGLNSIVTSTLTVGTMQFSIASFAQAIVMLFLTYYLAKGWRHFFHHNLLKESGLDKGIQESMTTITVYGIWIFGILVSMMAFGLNMTTLTVGFGALGIGIGFGLQNIVNNFFSGIILLFERPIQVGDDIEINGTWATIRKTNVRSTVVQTYDNATIMIPNSELISNQVINWSFKDKRLRRKVAVGVAYGSDIEKVREVLLDIARKMPKVLSYPAPDVLFNDFGDSALIFTLRFWSFIDFFLAVETDIRFEIDRRFKEEEIEIAFPQRDIHIRSLPPEWGLKASDPEPPKI